MTPDPQRERALEVAREWFHSDKVFGEDSLADLLLAFAQGERLEEAQWWHMQQPQHMKQGSSCCERIAELESAQPAKGRGR